MVVRLTTPRLLCSGCGEGRHEELDYPVAGGRLLPRDQPPATHGERLEQATLDVVRATLLAGALEPPVMRPNGARAGRRPAASVCR
jgi:hypothetical protein